MDFSSITIIFKMSYFTSNIYNCFYLNNGKEVYYEYDGAVGAYRQLPLGKEDGTLVFSYCVFTVEPGGHPPFHNHPYEHMNYVIEGNGALVNDAGEETPLKAGDFTLVNPDERHQYRNKGNQPFKMICGVPKEFE